MRSNKKATQALEVLHPYFKKDRGIQGSVAEFLQDSPSKNFFPTRCLTQERRKIEYWRATYKKSTRIAVDFFCPTSRSIQGKRRIFLLTSYIQGQWKYMNAKEAVESARTGLLPQKGDVRKLRKEKKRKRPRKARRLLQRRQRSVCP